MVREFYACLHVCIYASTLVGIKLYLVILLLLYSNPDCLLLYYVLLYAAVCAPACQNGGVCTSPGQCACGHGWTGSRCDIRKLCKLRSKHFAYT